MIATVALSLSLVAGASAKARKVSTAPSTRALPASVKDSTAQEPDSLFYLVASGPSQTLSWIGLRHLGAWTPEIASQILRDNPDLRKAPLATGQRLRLRKRLDRRNLPPLQQIEMASRRAVITRLSGSVQRILADGSSLPLKSDDFVSSGERILTGPQAMAELIIDNQSILRLRANSQLELVHIQDSANLTGRKAATQVRLGFGRVWTKVRKWAGPLVGFEVRMPSGIAGVHGTIFECQVFSDSSSQVWVEEGVVGVQGNGKDSTEIPVTQGQSVRIDSSGTVSGQASQDLPDPTDLLPDPSLDTRTNSHDDLRASAQNAATERQAASESSAIPPTRGGKIHITARVRR